MKDKEKQIEEMAKVNHEKCSFCDTCDNCKYQWHEDCEKIKYATNIYNANYRKLPEDSVVLSREERQSRDYECQNIGFETGKIEVRKEFEKTCKNCHWISDYKILKHHEEEVIKLCEQEVKQASKETAEKIYKDIRLFLDDKTLAIITRYFKEILGVEIKE